MLRDKSLIPLSREHQHALALCVRIERAFRKAPVSLDPWMEEVDAIYRDEIKFHFAAEEDILFPAARRFPELNPLIDELLAEHQQLSDFFGRAHAMTMDHSQLEEFSTLLSAHIRKEERQLFEALQSLMSTEELAKLGRALTAREQGAASCRIPHTSK